MGIDVESLGFTKEELQQRVVDACVQQIFETTQIDEDGESFADTSPMARRLEASVKAAIDQRVAAIAEKHVLPMTENFIETLTLQQTTKWGEKVGEPVTFIDYLVKRAEEYLREEVNYQGKARSEDSSYGWTKSQTRITHLVNQHLQYSIDIAMKSAIANANRVIVGGIEDAVKIKLGEIERSLKVEVKTK